MNAVGRVQAEEVGRKLRDLVDDAGGLDFVGSPLSRTRETMEILRRSAGLREAYRTDPRFAELGFGRWEGHSWKDLRRLHPKAYAERERDRWGFTPPGGESYATMSVRVSAALAEIRQDTLVVAHGGVARAVMALLSDTAPAMALTASIWQGRILLFRDGEHRWV